MNFDQLVTIGFALFFSSMLQSTVGFGFSLLVVPVLLLQGFPLANAVTYGIIASAVHRATNNPQDVKFLQSFIFFPLTIKDIFHIL